MINWEIKNVTIGKAILFISVGINLNNSILYL
jgi:hypothetical protein